jgi:hypothetical protein
MSITLPRSLLQSLTTAFELEGKRLAKDVAAILHLPEKDVLQVVKQMPKLQFKVVEDSEYDQSCLVPIEEPGIVRRCRRPCVLGTSRCIYHQSSEVQTLSTSLQSLTRIKGHPYWCDEETKDVYDVKGECVGKLNDENQLELYTFEE